MDGGKMFDCHLLKLGTVGIHGLCDYLGLVSSVSKTCHCFEGIFKGKAIGPRRKEEAR
jgi:hypothetical protein